MGDVSAHGGCLSSRVSVQGHVPRGVSLGMCTPPCGQNS